MSYKGNRTWCLGDVRRVKKFAFWPMKQDDGLRRYFWEEVVVVEVYQMGPFFDPWEQISIVSAKESKSNLGYLGQVNRLAGHDEAAKFLDDNERTSFRKMFK